MDVITKKKYWKVQFKFQQGNFYVNRKGMNQTLLPRAREKLEGQIRLFWCHEKNKFELKLL